MGISPHVPISNQVSIHKTAEAVELIVPIEQTTRLGGDHVGGYLATTDYLRSIDTPQWKTALAEDFCERMRLPHVSSLSVSRGDDDDTASGVGIFLRIRDIGRMFHSPSDSSPLTYLVIGLNVLLTAFPDYLDVTSS
ncbi:unnamed protein product [Dibothriocephalus latus]|uniref:Uncharacterized protein n=1 Tax=Dibothriocephalus latus TaxID=60516 RepID=A0A3P7KWG8_DIBLA|nr:unnamed protein product [Dibothriocephalus latus]